MDSLGERYKKAKKKRWEAIAAFLFFYGMIGGMVSSEAKNLADQSMWPWHHPAITMCCVALSIVILLIPEDLF